ncbi:flagellar hook-associated protein 2 [Rossellomorea sp. BNER]|uniref:flagellar hook-associated protein 2 n=1 Tax=Rossellomorea sp. BNER TaxID=2962031 RepID=UPI003AF253F7|nr:flagellar hook-associated protein 2 [Rossellomorea sp. BNER]
MRIGGLASGMDIDSIVKDLMTAEKIPLNKLEQKKQYLEWQRDDYREINKMMFEFDSLIFDDLILQGTYTQKTVNVSDPNEFSIKNISSTSDFSGTIQVERLASAATMFSGSSTGIDPSKKLSDYITGTQTIKINAINPDGTMQDKPTEITFDPAEETIESLISKINSEANVSMFFDSVTGKAAVTAKNTGNNQDGAEIVLEGDFFTNVLNLQLDNQAAATAGNGSEGQNAKFTYNGLATERASNTFTINGFEVSLKNASNTPVTFNSSPDVDGILEKIVKFVDQYNKLIEKVNGELNEKRYRDFQPLTAEQKEAMEEKEKELWEEKAKSGTLRNDSILASAMNKMRSDLYSPVSGAGGMSQLAEIGITTSNNYLERGKLVIDEKKLKEAISKDPNAIYELFAKEGATTSEKGLARRLRDTLDATMKNVEEKAGKGSSTNSTFTLGRNLENIEDEIDRFQDRLIQIEDRYWRQFTAMEKAIQQSNQQSMFLMQQFGGGM